MTKFFLLFLLITTCAYSQYIPKGYIEFENNSNGEKLHQITTDFDGDKKMIL